MAYEKDPLITQEEEQLKGLDDELSKYQRGIEQASGIRNVANARDLAREMGFDPYELLGYTDEGSKRLKVLEGDPLDARQEFLRDPRYEAEHRNKIIGALEGRIRELTGKRTKLGEQAVDRRLSRVQENEKKLTSSLLSQQEMINSLVEQQLGRAVMETGIGANLARQAVGANAADRGMSRSTIAQQGLNKITTAELGEKGKLRQEALDAQSGVRETVTGAVEGIQKKREQLATRRSLAEIQNFEQVGFDIDVGQVQKSFQMELAQMELDARDEAFFSELVGGLTGNVARLFATGGM
jgi:hypothetical protein